ncbi:MAG TPA: AI-2E family transporter [Xanthobacteraceae bacterium]|jgi:predicted PurR-regulated permease PerM
MSADSAIRGMLALCTAVLVAGALFLAKSVFAPVAFSFFAMAIVWPLQRVLQARMPKAAALLVTVLLSLAVLAVMALAIAWSTSQVGRWLVGNLERFHFIYVSTNEWLEARGIVVSGFLAERFDVSWLVGLAQQAAGRLNSMAGFALLVFTFTMLGLLEVDRVTHRIGELERRAPGLKLLQAGERIARQFRTYMLIRTMASILTGFLTYCFALLVGVELAVSWGIISFVLNYVPVLGPIVAVVLTTLFAAAQFEALQPTLLVLAGLSVIQFSIGNYLEPLLAAVTLAISPFLVLFAVFFWTFLWGIPGAFIGVPMTIALLTICAQHVSSSWLPNLVSEPARAP